MATQAKRTTLKSVRRPRAAMGVNDFAATFDEIVANTGLIIRGKEEVVRMAVTAILCEGHVLFEDLPGTGKSMLARALSTSMNAESSRVQCTPDLLPADITGSSILDQRRGEFEFKPGPVFTNVLLADEINRASPKTQSALLEAMAEGRVTADGTTYSLPRPFVVLATQNPIEQGGTFPLPEAQLDRFLFRLSMGYLSRDSELEVMYQNSKALTFDNIGSVIDSAGVIEMIDFAATEIEVSQEVGLYIVDLVQGTRQESSIAVGASPRATISLLRACRVLAASDGRSQVLPDDVRTLADPVLAHRLALAPEALLRGESVSAALDRVVNSIKPPIIR
ncbi:MAG: ATPase associated with various cellular 3 [Frankiales bacterium]|nr:ATPase associated with various cellular 3 [Frankiales bacterium]